MPPFLDHLLAIDADGVAARALAEVDSVLANEPGEYRACLVVSDDLKGGCVQIAGLNGQAGYLPSDARKRSARRPGRKK
jgi:hypothetical protein